MSEWPPGPDLPSGFVEPSLEISLIWSVRGDVDLRVGGDGAWIEAEEGPLEPVPEGNITPMCLETRGRLFEAGEAVGERVSAALAGADDVSSALSQAGAAVDRARSSAIVGVEAVRRVLNAWLRVVEGAAAVGGPDVRYGECRAVASECFYVIATGRRSAAAGERTAEDEIAAVAALPQHPALAAAVAARLGALAEQVRDHYDAYASAAGVASGLEKHFAERPSAPFQVDASPVDFDLDLPAPLEPLVLVFEAMRDDSLKMKTEGRPGETHRDVARNLERDQIISVRDALRDKERMMEIVDWMMREVRVEKLNGNVREPTAERLGDWFAALGTVFGVEPAFSGGTIRKEYNLWKRRGAVD